MPLFCEVKEPIFLKESSAANQQLKSLRDLKPMLNSEGQSLINQEIKFLEYGMLGEQNIAHELRNSDVVMVVLHDIYLECDELSAQIDYLVFTKKMCFVLACKNLYGHVEINHEGDFKRCMSVEAGRTNDVIDDFIKQNEQFIELIKKLKIKKKKSATRNLMPWRFGKEDYQSVLVMSNPKPIRDLSDLKLEDKERIISVDQMVNHIKDKHNQSMEPELSDSQLFNWAQLFLIHQKEVKKFNTEKYDEYFIHHIPKDLFEPRFDWFNPFQIYEANQDLFE
ncbi:MAG: nuclease-related domain-containing protein [Turicibacter sp.]